MFDKKGKRGPKARLMNDIRNAHFQFGTDPGNLCYDFSNY